MRRVLGLGLILLNWRAYFVDLLIIFTGFKSAASYVKVCSHMTCTVGSIAKALFDKQFFEEFFDQKELF